MTIPDRRRGPRPSTKRAERLKAARRVLDTATEFEAGLIWSKRERHVLRLRLGLGGSRPLTLKEIGMELGVGYSKARRIESVALRELARNEAEITLSGEDKMYSGSNQFIDQLTEQLKSMPDSVDLAARRPFGGVVEVLRVSSHMLTQADLATKSGLSADVVRRLEGRQRRRRYRPRVHRPTGCCVRNSRIHFAFCVRACPGTTELPW